MAQVSYEEGQLMPLIPPVRGWRWQAHLVKPCGTPAAARRHYRHHEKPCALCRAAESRRWNAYAETVRREGKLLGGRWPARLDESAEVA